MILRLRIVSFLLLMSGVAQSSPVSPEPAHVLPAKAARVPRNAKLWVFGSGRTFKVVDSHGVEIPLTRNSYRTYYPHEFASLSPESQFEPGIYELLDGESTNRTFVVTDEVDTTPPNVPTATTSIAGQLGPQGALTRVTSPANDSFLLVEATSQSMQTMEGAVFWAGDDGELDLYGLAPGPATLRVFQVDLAGNLSEPLLMQVDVPVPNSCSVGALVPALALAGLLLRGRRRRT